MTPPNLVAAALKELGETLAFSEDITQSLWDDGFFDDEQCLAQQILAMLWGLT